VHITRWMCRPVSLVGWVRTVMGVPVRRWALATARITRSTPDVRPHLLKQVVLLSRLREVQALLGFTRLTAPDRRELEPVNRLSLSHSMPTWVPAFEQRGEGVFLELPEDRVRAWEQQIEDHPRITALRESFQRWSANRERPLDATLPIPRFLLLQTLSHLLIRQVALECGYGSSSTPTSGPAQRSALACADALRAAAPCSPTTTTPPPAGRPPNCGTTTQPPRCPPSPAPPPSPHRYQPPTPRTHPRRSTHPDSTCRNTSAHPSPRNTPTAPSHRPSTR